MPLFYLMGTEESTVEIPKSLAQQYSKQYSKQYSNSNSNFQNENNSNSTVEISTVFSNLTDIIPEDDYMPFYISRYKTLGYRRFMELANKARAGGKDPARLFSWMLKNNQLVR